MKKKIILFIVLSVFCFTGCAKDKDDPAKDGTAEQTSEEAEEAASEREQPADTDKNADKDTDADGKSLGERLTGCWIYVDEDDPSDGTVFEITEVCGNLFGAGAYCLEADGEYEISGVTQGYELIPIKTGDFERADIDGCDIGLTMYDLMNNGGQTYTAPRSCSVSVTDDGIVIEAGNGEDNPVTLGASKAVFKPYDEHLTGFSNGSEIKPEICKKPSSDLYGLWRMKNSDLFIEFLKSEQDPYEGQLKIYQKISGEVPFVATGIFYSDGDEIICGCRRIGAYPEEFTLDVEKLDGDTLTVECNESPSGLFDGKKTFMKADEDDVPSLTVEDAPEYDMGQDASEEGEFSGALEYLNTTFYGVWVQAGDDRDKLYETADDFAADGFDDCLVVSTADFENLSDKVAYSLTVGKFDSEADAEKRLEEVKKLGFTDAYVKNTGAYLSDNYYYVTSTLEGFDVDEENGEIWIKGVEVQFPYSTGYEQSGASTVMTLYLDKDTVFVPDDPADAGFGNYKKGETPYDWFVKNYRLSEEDPDVNNDALMALRGVFEVTISGNHIDQYIGSYWWD